METIMSVAIITALFGGLATILKLVFGGNKTKQEDYAHQEKIIELITKQNDNSDKLLAAIDSLHDEVIGIKAELSDLNVRVLKLEQEQEFKLNS